MTWYHIFYPTCEVHVMARPRCFMPLAWAIKMIKLNGYVLDYNCYSQRQYGCIFIVLLCWELHLSVGQRLCRPMSM